jgi:hypothetical protein
MDAPLPPLREVRQQSGPGMPAGIWRLALNKNNAARRIMHSKQTNSR